MMNNLEIILDDISFVHDRESQEQLMTTFTHDYLLHIESMMISFVQKTEM